MQSPTMALCATEEVTRTQPRTVGANGIAVWMAIATESFEIVTTTGRALAGDSCGLRVERGTQGWGQRIKLTARPLVLSLRDGRIEPLVDS